MKGSDGREGVPMIAIVAVLVGYEAGFLMLAAYIARMIISRVSEGQSNYEMTCLDISSLMGGSRFRGSSTEYSSCSSEAR